MPQGACSVGVAVQHGGTSIKADHSLPRVSGFQGCGQMTSGG
jgi:hypothetical protein